MTTPSDVIEDICLDDYCPEFPAALDNVKCGECGAVMEVRRGIEGKPFYGCSTFPGCRGTHGAHPDGRPLGIPADKATRKARVEAHRFFDLLWKASEGQKPRMTRNQAYAWMRRKMKLSESEAHFSKFTLALCNECVRLIKESYPGVRTLWDRLADDDAL